MMYIQVPRIITYKDLAEKYLLSPGSYRTITFKNKNVKKIRDLLSEKPQKGQEVGSFSYINRSNFYFIRTKALQSSCFLPVLDDIECAVPILPIVFKNFRLRKGDILVSKDANIGDAACLSENLPNFMISGGIVRLRFPENIKYYALAFMKNEFFKSQVELMTARGATIKHAKTLWLDALIPFSNQQNADETIKFVSLLTKAVIRKEVEIKKKYRKIIDLIDEELEENQKPSKFVYCFPSFRELQETGRIDTGLYTEEFKRKCFKIENYKNGYSNLDSLGYKIKRGQNLQISSIGKSIYSEEEKKGFYRLILSGNITEFMTVEKYSYLGNPKKLKTVQEGDIIFTCRGDMGRCLIFCKDINNTITNIDNVHIINKKTDIIDKIYLGCFLRYLKEVGIMDKISIKGGGAESFTKYQFDMLKIPNFPRSKKREISKYYYNPTNYKEERLNFIDLENEDIRVTTKSGIWQLDKQIKQIKQKLDTTLHKIIMDEDTHISFDFLRDE